ncbi:MAG: hypothetical protein NT016_01160 [Candidatus Aenigmarchaeota archaeon]|nr:hypothetical protein [Candidatus Aenigmarchaeota archaeon]
MDYDELKEKYDQRLDDGQKLPVKAIAIAVLVIVVAVAAYYLWTSGMFVAQSTPEKVMGELVSISAQNDTVTLADRERCSKIQKSDTEWTISGCTDDIEIHLTFYTDEYVMTICGGWVDGRSVARSSSVLTYLGILKQGCDANTISLLMVDGSTSVYDVCGKKLYMKDGCIV